MSDSNGDYFNPRLYSELSQDDGDDLNPLEQLMLMQMMAQESSQTNQTEQTSEPNPHASLFRNPSSQSIQSQGGIPNEIMQQLLMGLMQQSQMHGLEQDQWQEPEREQKLELERQQLLGKNYACGEYEFNEELEGEFNEPLNFKEVPEVHEVEESKVEELSDDIETTLQPISLETQSNPETTCQIKPSIKPIIEEQNTTSNDVLKKRKKENDLNSFVKHKKSRCDLIECRKKVGLLGFVCKCGYKFCALHRYAEKHHCSYDFKNADKEKLKKNNPQITTDKINNRI